MRNEFSEPFLKEKGLLPPILSMAQVGGRTASPAEDI